jgi:hypothetical protein
MTHAKQKSYDIVVQALRVLADSVEIDAHEAGGHYSSRGTQLAAAFARKALEMADQAKGDKHE